MTDQPYDRNYWGPDGPRPSKWGWTCGRGEQRKDTFVADDFKRKKYREEHDKAKRKAAGSG